MFFEPTKINCTMICDPQHGVNENIWGALQGVNKKGFMYVNMMVLNLNCGPEETDVRYNQIRAEMDKHYKTMSADTSPIFGAWVPHDQRIRGDRCTGR